MSLITSADQIAIEHNKYGGENFASFNVAPTSKSGRN
jgi:hypothetical protein